ncbi:MAG: hypothetical protein AAF368_03215 [Planctomycetota bacterium]
MSTNSTSGTEKGTGIASESLEHGYERTDAKGLPLIGFILFLLAGTFLVMLFTSWMLGQFKEHRQRTDLPRHVLADEKQEPPAPTLQAYPNTDYGEYELNQRLQTETYSFIDREAGQVLLPVERAMELVLEEGIQRPDLPADEVDEEGR